MTTTVVRARNRVREVGAFGVVGLAGYLTDVAVFNLLRYAGDPGLLEDRPLTAKVISVAVAMVVTYLGNRQWTWRGRSTHTVRREVALFVLMNGIGMLIAVGCLAFSHYVLGLDSALADNISANVVGLSLGTLFRFWAYRRFVFPEVDGLRE
ncbi:GtrA family protein [Mumia sp. DW29H23]|uniref:GtrA family protein n=1 Tax=Mumia sp. DW29H23 TaxID=3421241 RepID=UPI003D690A08